MKTPILTLAVVTGTLVWGGTALAQYGDPYTNLVNNWYVRYLDRTADPIGLASHVHELRRGISPEFVEASILGSQEYYSRNGNRPEGFIYGLYNDVLGATPSPGEVRHWMQVLLRASNRHVFALRFLQETRVIGGTPPAMLHPGAPAFPPSSVIVPRPRVTPGPRTWPEPWYSYPPRPGTRFLFPYNR